MGSKFVNLDNCGTKKMEVGVVVWSCEWVGVDWTVVIDKSSVLFGARYVVGSCEDEKEDFECAVTRRNIVFWLDCAKVELVLVYIVRKGRYR